MGNNHRDPNVAPQVALQVNVLALLRRAGRAACEAESVELATALQQLLVTCCQASFQTGLNTKPFQYLKRLNEVLGCVGLLHVLDSHWLISQSSLEKSRDIIQTFIEIQY